MGHGEPMPPDMMGAVMVLDARTGGTIRSRMTPAMNHNAIYSPNGQEIWTSKMMMDMRVSRKNIRPVSLGVVLGAVPIGVTGGQPSPKDSSMKLTTLPSQLNVAECQKSTATSSPPGPSVSTREEAPADDLQSPDDGQSSMAVTDGPHGGRPLPRSA